MGLPVHSRRAGEARRRQVLSREQLMEMTFEDPGAADARGVDVAILSLRRALGAHKEIGTEARR
jgi:DNA-binding response OmpR family regulator